MPDSQMNFGNLNISGGMQNFGGTNTNTQHNYYQGTPREQLEEQLAVIRATHPDPAVATRETQVIEGAIAHPSPESRTAAEAAIKRLSENAGNMRTAAEAIAAVGALVVAHWPF